jgi:mannan endo-1,4-beta-mannosidase
VDYYLNQMKTASTTAGKRLLDVFDFHWYPEATGDHRIVLSNATSNADSWERMQAPRSLWDPTYQENSYIGQWFSGYLPLITRLQTSINTYYPGTKLSVSEYNYGPGQLISTGIAHADVLGIFGKYGVYNANLWFLNNSSAEDYTLAAFRIYTNYDGSNHTFGNTSVSATTSDIPNTSVYASIDGTDDRVLHIIAINKNSIPVSGTFNFTSGSTYTNAAVWNFHDGVSTITKTTDISLTGNSFNYILQPLSVNHIVLTNFSALPVSITSFTVKAQNEIPRLQWATAGETGIASYVVERSCNGHDFTSIGEVKPANAGTSGRSYNYADLHFMDCGAAADHIWYRVKSIENSGAVNYTETRTFTPDHSDGIQLFPNPAANFIRLTGLPSNPVDIELLNSDGSLIKKYHTENTTQYSIDVSSLPGNLYIIKAVTTNKTAYLKFIKR